MGCVRKRKTALLRAGSFLAVTATWELARTHVHTHAHTGLHHFTSGTSRPLHSCSPGRRVPSPVSSL